MAALGHNLPWLTTGLSVGFAPDSGHSSLANRRNLFRPFKPASICLWLRAYGFTSQRTFRPWVATVCHSCGIGDPGSNFDRLIARDVFTLSTFGEAVSS